MAITANVTLDGGILASSCYIIIPNAYVTKFAPTKDSVSATFKLIYDAHIYQNKSDRDDYGREGKKLRCRAVDHHKTDYDPTTSDNPFVLAYTDLKTNSTLSSVADA